MELKRLEEQQRNEQQNEQENGKWRDKGQLVLTQPISTHVSATELMPLSFKLMMYSETFDLSHEDSIRAWCCLHLSCKVLLHLVFILHFFLCEIFSVHSDI